MMSIEELQKAFLDLDFQANRIAKLKSVDPEHLHRYNQRSEEVRKQLLQMQLNDSLNESLQALEPIDENFQAAFSLGRKVLNVFSFGLHKKRYLPKKQEAYFRKEVAERSRLYQYAKGQLTID
jgi:hypothetical protein